MTTPTDIIYIMDRSGSMSALMGEAIGGFNAFIEEQKKIPGECYVTLVLFDSEYEIVYDRVDIQTVEPLTSATAYARGLTALYDAIGKAISKVPDDWHVITLVMTDGEENSSREWTKTAAKAEIERKQAAGWEFQFVGVGIDAFAEGASLGFKSTQIKNVSANASGIRGMSASYSVGTTSYRGS